MLNENEYLDVFAEGVLEILPDGHGLLRSAEYNYAPGPDDIHVSRAQILALDLRTGDALSGQVRPPSAAEKYFVMTKIDSIRLASHQPMGTRLEFELLHRSHPREMLRLETTPENLCCRIIDLMSPLGKGQRSVIIGPRHNGQKAVLESISNSLAINHREVDVIVLLIDQHPGEAATMARCLKGEVVFSTQEETCARHVQLAELVLEKAKRRVEEGRDVVILLDSITNLFRAYQELLPFTPSPDPSPPALQRTKRILDAATSTQEAGSLTLVAILDTETGSPLATDLVGALKSVIDARIVLDPRVARDGIFPAINIRESITRNAEFLVPKDDLSRIWILRRVLDPLSPAEAVKLLGSKLLRTPSNAQFLTNMSSL